MRKVIPTQEELDVILKMYNEENLGSHYISQKTGLSRPTILRILKDNGIDMKPSGRRNIGGREVAMKKYFSKPETKERLKKNYSEWYEENKEHRKQYLKEYREKNIDKIRKIKRDYEKNRKNSDPLYKLVANFRTAIWTVLKESNVDKYGHYFDVLQYTPEELIIHLEKQFKDDMTWDNYGIWHVDHKLPITSFDIQEMGDDEFMKCWCLDNLQPMWGEENIRKSNKILEDN
jgi:predicted DNA-binding transcriptional regulator AlpA